MERDSGYLRIDAPANSTLSVQIKWIQAAKPAQASPSLFTLMAPQIQRFFRRGPEPMASVNLRDNLDRLIKETAKAAKKSKATFDSTVKSEKIEGENGERRAMNFSWVGAGKGQGKIWHCTECDRIMMAQVVGMQKDQSAIPSIASQLFSTLQDHGRNGLDLWALYGLELEVPDTFRLESQQILSGHQRLVFGHGGERIYVNRWGLANMALRKFTLAEWFKHHAATRTDKFTEQECTSASGHPIHRWSGKIGIGAKLRALRESKGSLKPMPAVYDGGIWLCEASNRIYTIETLMGSRSTPVWEEIVSRCACH
jgi:hypothetical protein